MCNEFWLSKKTRLSGSYIIEQKLDKVKEEFQLQAEVEI